MKIKSLLFILFITIVSCGEPPTQFTDAVLSDTFVTIEGQDTQLRDILEKHRGNQIVINVWAQWCKDCIVGMPDLRALQAEYSKTTFVFLSVDRNEAAWKRSLTKYKLTGDHYFIPNGQKGAFGDFLNSNWIPRYMVIDPKGNIKLFKAKKATDKNIKNALL